VLLSDKYQNIDWHECKCKCQDFRDLKCAFVEISFSRGIHVTLEPAYKDVLRTTY
jgi:hypothetical protein